jgi:2-hydroxychromene-2-carboxylate isomerase
MYPSKELKHITFYFDVISPYAYLAFEQLPKALIGLSFEVRYKPVLFAAMLKHHGQLGPAEIAPKRDWTYRHVLWLAHTHGVALDMPVTHPFNPLPLLRLALAASPAGSDGCCNRHVAQTLFRYVWQGGLEASDAQRLTALSAQFESSALRHEDAKAELKKNTQEAIDKGVFGVPAMCVDDKIFWGLDALPMLREFLLGKDWFTNGEWEKVSQLGPGLVRG